MVGHQEVKPQHPDQTQVTTSAMGERTQKADFDYFAEVNNAMLKLAKEKFEDYDELRKRYFDLEASHKQIMEENQSLRRR